MALVGEFQSKDLKISWTRNPANDDTNAITLHYAIEFYDGTTLLRQDTTTATEYTYYYDDMLIDRPAGPVRDITVKLYEVDTFLVRSGAATATFSNDPPAAPTFTTTATVDTVVIEIEYDNPDSDFAGYYICRSTTPGFTPGAGNVIYQGTDLKFIDKNLTYGVNYYYRVAAYDKFSYSVADLSFANEQVVVGPSAIEFDEVTIEFDNVEFSVNGNTVSWTSGQAIRLFNGTAVTKTVPAGSYAWTSGKVYIFFDWASGSVLTTTLQANAFSGRDNRIIAVYSGGTDLHIGTQKPIVDGANIIAGTIGASQLITTSAIITDTAQIADAIITNVKILDGEITVDKLDTDSFFAQGLALFGGDLRSSNYVANTSGWQIASNGDAEFNNLVTRGWITVGAISDFTEYNSTTSVTINNSSSVNNMFTQSYTCPADNFLFFASSLDVQKLSGPISPGETVIVECWLEFTDSNTEYLIANETYTMLQNETRTTHGTTIISDARPFTVWWRVSHIPAGGNTTGYVVADNAKYFSKVVQR